MNKFGKNITISIEGTSHSEKIVLSVKGIKKGESISLDIIKQDLQLRNAKLFFNTQRNEQDDFEVVSGIENEKTTGKEIKIVVQNKSVNKAAYEEHKGFLRPSHSDYVRMIKENSKNIESGGGLSSGRTTLPLTIAGSIAKQILNKKGVVIASHIQRMCGAEDDRLNESNIQAYIQNRNNQILPVLSKSFEKECIKKLKKIKEEKNSCGATIETLVVGVDPGLGEPIFASLESKISQIMFSIPSVKAIEFGDGKDFANFLGSQVEDSFVFDKKNNKIITSTNHNGGINGGISNGMPIIIKTTIKPIPTIGQPLTSYNAITKQEETVIFGGNHDVFVGNRVVPVVDGAVALVLLDMMCEREEKICEEF